MIRTANRKSCLQIFICCALFFFVSGNSGAQLLIGPKAGAQLSWINLADEDLKENLNIEPLRGYHAGFALAFQVQKRFYLETSFLYSRKGKIIEGVLDPLLKYESVTHHIDMPVIYRMDFKGQLGKGKEFKWYVGVGPNVSYWLGGEGTLVSTELRAEQGISELEVDVVFDGDVNDDDPSKLAVVDPNRIQLGINFASGVAFEPPGGNFIVLEFRFELGHSYQAKEEFARFPNLLEFADPVRSRNAGLRVSLSYMFDTKVAERKKGKSTIKK